MLLFISVGHYFEYLSNFVSWTKIRLLLIVTLSQRVKVMSNKNFYLVEFIRKIFYAQAQNMFYFQRHSFRAYFTFWWFSTPAFRGITIQHLYMFMRIICHCFWTSLFKHCFRAARFYSLAVCWEFRFAAFRGMSQSFYLSHCAWHISFFIYQVFWSHSLYGI